MDEILLDRQGPIPAIGNDYWPKYITCRYYHYTYIHQLLVLCRRYLYTSVAYSVVYSAEYTM